MGSIGPQKSGRVARSGVFNSRCGSGEGVSSLTPIVAPPADHKGRPYYRRVQVTIRQSPIANESAQFHLPATTVIS